MPKPRLNTPRETSVAISVVPIPQLNYTALEPLSRPTAQRSPCSLSTSSTDTLTIWPRNQPTKGSFSTALWPTTSGCQPPMTPTYLK